MILKVLDNKIQLAEAAARQAAEAINQAVRERGRARIIAATGASQFEFLRSLIENHEVDWKKVEMFHLDEYVGLPVTHPASFRKYLMERLIKPSGLEIYHLLDGQDNPQQVCESTGQELASAPIDVAFVGIGENGHLAFNDPPADFVTEAPYIIVDLDEACRRQQVGEGWFSDISEVPTRAISMSIQQILKANEIICIVPDARKAEAVRNCMSGEVSPDFPASVLRNHPNTTLYLDPDSASLLDRNLITR